MQTMYYIGLDVHKRTICYCVKDGSGTMHPEGTIPATRFDLDRWMKTLPQPWTAAMEATGAHHGVDVGAGSRGSAAFFLDQESHQLLRVAPCKTRKDGATSKNGRDRDES
jgi:hypothetical protein